MSEISLEELLKTLEEAEEVKEEVKKPVHKDLYHVDRFVKDLDVKCGLDRIPNYIIFYTYKKVWEGVQDNKKARKIKFFRSMNKRFTRVRDGKTRYYLLNADAFDLTREGKLKAKHYDEKYQKAIKTKQSKKSKSTKEVQPKE